MRDIKTNISKSGNDLEVMFMMMEAIDVIKEAKHPSD